MEGDNEQVSKYRVTHRVKGKLKYSDGTGEFWHLVWFLFRSWLAEIIRACSLCLHFTSFRLDLGSGWALYAKVAI